MEDKLLKIINNYGVLNQTRQFNEECYELTEAIFDYEYTEDSKKNGKLKKHIAEEIADNLVLLKQFQYYYNIEDEDIEKTINYKIDRTLQRMEEGYYDR